MSFLPVPSTYEIFLVSLSVARNHTMDYFTRDPINANTSLVPTNAIKYINFLFN